MIPQALVEAVRGWESPHDCWLYESTCPDDGTLSYDVRVVNVPEDELYAVAGGLIRYLLISPVAELPWAVFAHPSSERQTVLDTCGLPGVLIGPSEEVL